MNTFKYKSLLRFLQVISIVFYIFYTPLYATDVSGNQSGTWKNSGSPYIVKGNVIIPSGQTLIIESGVIIKFDDGFGMTINGNLIAKGNSIDTIKFTSSNHNPKPGQWKQLNFTNTSSESQLSYCIIEFGGYENICPVQMIANTLIKHYSNLYRHNGIEAIGIKGGNIRDNDITWYYDGGEPYRILDRISVYGSTNSQLRRLTIQAGVTVKFDSSTGLRIGNGPTFGELRAIGKSDSLITFTSWNGKNNAWEGIFISNNNNGNNTDSTIMEYCVVENAGQSFVQRANIYCHSALYLTLKHCTIRNSAQDGIYLNIGNLEISDCTIQANGRYGIFSSVNTLMITGSNFNGNGSYPLLRFVGKQVKHFSNSYEGNGIEAIGIKGGNIRDNDITWYYDGGEPYRILDRISVYGSTNSQLRRLTIQAGVTVKFDSSTGLRIGNGPTFGELRAIGKSDSLITFTSWNGKNNAWEGIFISNNNNGNNTDSTIMEYCVVENAGQSFVQRANIYCHSAPYLTLKYCTIRNSAQDGIYLNIGNLEISDCNLMGNSQHGIYCYGGSSPSIEWSQIKYNGYGITTQNASARIRFSNLYNNNYYDIENLGTQYIDAAQNYWGENTTSEMEFGNNPKNISKLFDFFDNLNYGRVDYSEWLTKKLRIISISPNRSPNLGLLHSTIRGMDFQKETMIKLTREGCQDIVASQTTFIDSSRIELSFDLTGRQLGYWNVVVQNPDDQISILPNSLTIGEGYVNLWIEIVGRNTIRVNREQTYYIECGNSGNISAHRVLIEATVVGALLNTSIVSAFEDNIEAFTLDTLHFIILDLKPDSVVSIPITVKNIPNSTNIYFKVNCVDASILFEESKPKISLNIASVVNVISENSYDNLPYYKVNSDNDPNIGMDGAYIINWSETTHCGTVIYLDGKWYVAENLNTPIPPLPPYGPPLGSLSGFRLTPWPVYMNRVKNCSVYYVKIPMTNSQNTNLKNLCKLYAAFPLLYEPIGWKCTQATSNLYLSAGIDFPLADPITFPAEIFINLTGTLPPDLFPSVSLFPKWRSLQEWINEQLANRMYWRIAMSKYSRTNVVRSCDPNEKNGPLGYTLFNYVAKNKSMDYYIFFENVDTASAAAQEIKIIDTLDINLDWSSFGFNDVKIGITNIPLNKNIGPITKKILWNDTTYLNLESNIDLSDGRVEWNIYGIDKRTGQLADILQPNKYPPEGEGWVSFFVKPKTELITNANIKNKASIIFDVNQAVLTNEINNRIDADIPVSTVKPLMDSSDISEIKVCWSGTDNGSGIRNYSIYVSEKGGPYSTWLEHTSDTIASYVGQSGKTYCFYSISWDSVGNREASPTQQDATIRILTTINEEKSFIPNEFALWQNYPNPFNLTTTITFDVPILSNVIIKIYDILGREVYTLIDQKVNPGRYKKIWNGKSIHGFSIASGVYLIKMESKGFIKSKKLVLLK